MKSELEIEFFINVSPVILFPRLSTAGGLVEWFADDIRVNEDVFTFIWDGVEYPARILHQKKNRYIRFKWLDDQDNQSYFEFKILEDDLTGDVTLLVTDFAEEEEKSDVSFLWEKQVDNLKNALGVT
ncbi:MAG: START-like domain-containing protein [Bacteroidales bacterium]|nr:SRPBCC domain-containing protein [Bacteroidales bacterium]MBS3774511.1 SRPBCC domain-containing protein [Bacteroidales bacterium]